MTRVTGAHAEIGVSGWAYREWQGKFYPKGLARAKELAYAAERIPTIEMNSPFYRLQQESTYQKWAAAVPENFTFAVKGWRGVTHFKKLRGAKDAVDQFFNSGVWQLGDKLGPVLWQLPPSLKFDAEVMENFFEQLPKHHPETAKPVRYAVEPRDESFNAVQVEEIFREHNVALVNADSAGRHPHFDALTADFAYVRLHGSPRIYYSNYTEEALAKWATRISGWMGEGADCYLYFDNTAAGHAPANALQLRELLQNQGGQ